jgi:hypothetical protein
MDNILSLIKTGNIPFKDSDGLDSTNEISPVGASSNIKGLSLITIIPFALLIIILVILMIR